MNASEDLFQLIKSLSQNEKRYFRIYASAHILHGKNNYMRLFEAIARQKIYDEKYIKQKFSRERFVKQLSVVKNYLYNLILKSLRNYHSSTSANAVLVNMLRDIEILYDKGLFQEAQKRIKKARRDVK